MIRWRRFIPKFPDGSSGAPSITFGADPDTGFYRSAADTIDFTAGGTNALSLTTTTATIPAASALTWSGRSKIASGADGNLVLTPNNASSTLSTLDFGGAAASPRFATASNSVTLSARTSGVLDFKIAGQNGQDVGIKTLTELTTIAAAATTDTTIQIPANALVIGVSVRVTVVIPTAATFDVGVAGATTRYGTGISTAANTTNASPGTTNPTIYGSAVSIRFTPNLTPADTTGRVRTTIHYIDMTAPTS